MIGAAFRAPLAVVALALGVAGQAQPVLRPYTAPSKSYETFVADMQTGGFVRMTRPAIESDHPQADWAALRDSAALRVDGLIYESDGLPISGYVIRPIGAKAKHPVLIWARGGVGAGAAIGESQLVQMAGWARRGYVVVASNYRGEVSGAGKDEFAGADVNDLHALARYAQTLPEADASRMFAVGFSRGGLMLFRAVAEGLPVKAFATAGALTNVAAVAAARPQLAETFARMMPDIEAERASGFCRRSPACWPERVRAPVLIAHGTKDQVIDPAQATEMAERLKAIGRNPQLMLIEEGDHGVNGHRADFFAAADRLFRAQS